MGHWIVCPTRNNLHLLRKAVETFRAQDIGDVSILIIDNCSSDNTAQWLQTQHDLFREWHSGYGRSVARSWNGALSYIFDNLGEDYCLVVNNDVELRPDTYRWLVADGGLFVTAVGTRDPEKIKPNGVLDRQLKRHFLDPDPAKKRPHPDFSCFLIRREVWNRVGPFDEKFLVGYCEDSCYHLRMHMAGIRAEALELPFLHLGAQTITNATNEERDRIAAQAQKNREYFIGKYGFAVGSPEYYAAFNVEAPQEETI